MKKTAIKVLSLIAALCFALFLGACGSGDEPTGGRIATPEVVVCNDGSVIWSPVEKALYYAYSVDGGEEIFTQECTCFEPLKDGQSVRVKAVSGDEALADSNYSAPQTYHKEVVDPDHVHSDVDGDGICDRGGESVLVGLSIYAVNDLHGKFMDTSTQPGLDEFTTYMKGLYADPAREEILISSGDMWQGSVESSSNKGALMTEWMNEVGFSSMTLGNHEYDWGADVLTPNSELAEFPFLAINVLQNGVMPAYCKASVVVEKGGVKVGIIGAIGDCLSSISGEFSGGLEFKTGDALTALVKNEAVRLRTEEGCDFIVYSIHDGGSGYSSSGVTEVSSDKLTVKDGNTTYEYYDTALSDGFVDLVFEAHTHQRYILQDKLGVYHLQGGGENSAVSRADVAINILTKEYTVQPSILLPAVYAADSLNDDPFIEENYKEYFQDPEQDPYEIEIGHNASTRRSTEIVEKVAELYFNKGVEVWGQDHEIVLGGGYLSTRKPYDLSYGPVHYADLYSILPFDNHIVLGLISGSKLKSNFINSTNQNYHVYPTVSAAEISNSQQYYIVTDTYTAYYRWNGITEVARLEGDIYARDLLKEFIAEGGWE